MYIAVKMKDVADIISEILAYYLQMPVFPLVHLTLLKTFLLLSAFDLIDSSTSGGDGTGKESTLPS